MDENLQAKAYLVGFVVLLILGVLFYSADASGEGYVASKWAEPNGDDGTAYYVQMEDGQVLGVFWGTKDWDKIHEGSYIRYTARGLNLNIFGWRIGSPDIFDLKSVENRPR
jgi:hypothetical protein